MPPMSAPGPNPSSTNTRSWVKGSQGRNGEWEGGVAERRTTIVTRRPIFTPGVEAMRSGRDPLAPGCILPVGVSAVRVRAGRQCSQRRQARDRAVVQVRRQQWSRPPVSPGGGGDGFRGQVVGTDLIEELDVHQDAGKR